MASVSDQGGDPLAVRPWGRDAIEGSKSEQYLARRFAAAIADFKGMVVATFLLAAAVAAVAWVLVGVLVEHWLMPGGLPAWARWTWLAIGLAAAVGAAARWLMPLVRYRVNLVFAARAIERDHPELHNDLVNAVLVKERGDEAAEAVVKSLRRRAARRLSGVPDEGVVDRTPAVRLSWILAALVGLICLYELFAPKSFVVSAARLIAPWSGFASPSRVSIAAPRLAWRMPGEDPTASDVAGRTVEVIGGVAELDRGRQLVIAARIDGLEAGEKPELLVRPLREDGTPDPAAAAWTMPLATGAGGVRIVVVPDEERGLDQPLEVTIAAGDARSDQIRLVLSDAPALLVREVLYRYPEYTGREDETLPWQGDIQAVEGTRVTITTESNRPLETAAIDLGCDGRRDVSLGLERPENTRGSGTFTLKLSADRSGPEFGAYRFVYRPRAGAPGRSEADVLGSLEHRIEVVPDLAPEVSIEVPEAKVLKVPPAAPVTVRVKAVDPDFGLASVLVETRLAGGAVKRGEELLVGGPRKAAIVAETLVPESLGARPGMVLEYRAVASDTRPEKANETASEWRSLQIDASAPPQEPPPPPQEQAEGGRPEGEQQQPGDGGSDEGGDKPEGKEGDSGEDKPVDEGMKDGQDPKQGGDAGQQGDQKQGDQKQGDQKQGDQKQGDQKQEGDTPGEQKGDQKGDQGKQADGSQGQKPSQQGKGNDQKPGDGAEPNGKQPGQGSGKQGDNREGEGQGQQGGGRQQGQKQDGQKQGDQKEGGQRQAGQRQGDEQGEKRNEGQAGEKAGDLQGQRKPDPAVAADGTNDGEAMERILENRRRKEDRERKGDAEQDAGGIRQNQSMRAVAENVKMNQSQNQNGQVDQRQLQQGQQKQEQNIDAKVSDVDLTQNQDQDGPVQQTQAQKGAASQKQDLKGEANGTKLQQSQQQQEGIAQSRQSESGKESSEQRLEAETNQESLQQQERQQQQVDQRQDRMGESQPEAGAKKDEDEHAQQQPKCESSDGKPCGKPGCSSCDAGTPAGRGGSGAAKQDAQGQSSSSQSPQFQGEQNQSVNSQSHQKQGGQGQSIIDQNNQAQNQQSQTVVGQTNQAQSQQGQALIGQGGEQQSQPQDALRNEVELQGVEQQGTTTAAEGSSELQAQVKKGDVKAVQGASGSVGEGSLQQDMHRSGSVRQMQVQLGDSLERREVEWGRQNLDHARNAANLAVEHLRNALDQGRQDVLDELGWTPEQARAFLNRWQAMQRLADSADPAERAEYERAVRSLGLRTEGVRASRDVPSDVKGGQAEGRRSRPPSDYREQFKAFMQGTSAP